MENANFLDIDECVNHTCANGGLCVGGVNSYSGAPRAREARARGRSPIAKEIYPSQKIW